MLDFTFEGSNVSAPVAASTAVTLSNVRAGQTVTATTNGLTGITDVTFQKEDDTVLQTGSTSLTYDIASNFSAMGTEHIKATVTCNEGTFTSYLQPVYPAEMMGMAMSDTMLKDDMAGLDVVPHADATHIVTADGALSAGATWEGSNVPGAGAIILVPRGRELTWDQTNASIRYDRIRVDGTLKVDTSSMSSTDLKMLIETIFTSRGSTLEFGTRTNPIPDDSSFEVIFSGRDFSSGGAVNTDLNATRFGATRGRERGLICHGAVNINGAARQTWVDFEPMSAGATSGTARSDVTGWAVGMTIRIGGCDADYTYVQNSDHAPVFFDEERVITSIVGRVVSWDAGQPLLHDHKQTNPLVLREDCYPAVICKEVNNMTFRSEAVFPNHRRAHAMFMHKECTAQVKNADFVDMGRTDKKDNDTVGEGEAGVIDDNGDFKNRNLSRSPNTQSTTLAVTNNLQGLYPAHFHRVVDGSSLEFCGIHGSPGWGAVDHDNEMLMYRNSGTDIFGCFMVGEEGSETGQWFDNCFIGTTYYSVYMPNKNGGKAEDMRLEPKNFEANKGALGNTFSFGYAYGMRGRAITAAGNKAHSYICGQVFWPRTNTQHSEPTLPGNPITGTVKNVDISDVLLKVIGIPIVSSNGSAPFVERSTHRWVDVPILGEKANEFVGGLFGMFITKNSHKQRHGVHSHIKGFKVWGYRFYAASNEYVAHYLLDGFDCICGAIALSKNDGGGWRFGANQHGVITKDFTIAGCGHAAFPGNRGDTQGFHDDYSQDDPRWGITGFLGSNNAAYLDIGGSSLGQTKSVADVMWDSETDMYDDFDYTQDPYWTYDNGTRVDNVLGAFSGKVFGSFFSFNLSSGSNGINNSRGSLITQLSNNQKLAPNPMGDVFFGSWDTSDAKDSDLEFRSNTNGNYNRVRSKGFWTINGSTQRYLYETYGKSDPVTGRLGVQSSLVRWTNTNPTGLTNNGDITLTSTPVVQSDITVVTPMVTPVDIDVVTGATGGTGTIALNTDWAIKPNNGTIELLTPTANEVRYTPRIGYSGVDTFQVVLESGGEFKTVLVKVLVGAQTAVAVPAPTTNFTANGGSGQITIDTRLSTGHVIPDDGGEEWRRFEYETNDNGQWRLFCHKHKMDLFVLTVDSAGNALTAGSYDVKVRGKTFFGTTTAGSAADPVTVT